MGALMFMSPEADHYSVYIKIYGGKNRTALVPNLSRTKLFMQ